MPIMKLPSPKLTIGLPTYKRPRSLFKSIQQILDQSFTDFELIIINDASNDETAIVVSKFEDRRIHFIENKKNLGVADSLNRILSLARGEYFIYLSDHDNYERNLLSECTKALDDNQKLSLAMPGLFKFDKHKKKIRFDNLDWPFLNSGEEKIKEYLMQESSFSSPFHASCMYRLRSLKEIGLFYDPNYSYFSDIDLTLRTLVNTDFVYIDKMLIGVTEREEFHQLNFKQIESLKIVYQINSKFLHFLKIQNNKTIRFLDLKTKISLHRELRYATLKGFNYFKEMEKRIIKNFPNIKYEFYELPNVIKFCLYLFKRIFIKK